MIVQARSRENQDKAGGWLPQYLQV